MSVMILDAGNSIIKAKIARRERGEVAFPHALKQLTEAEYTNVVSPGWGCRTTVRLSADQW